MKINHSLKISVVISLIINFCYGQNSLKNINDNTNTNNFKKMIIKSNGKIRIEYYKIQQDSEDEHIKKSTLLNNIRKPTKNQQDFRISFGNKNFDIGKFEAKYNVKYKKRIGKSYYIFKNTSLKSDAELIEEIISNEPSVRDIRPSLKMKVKLL